MTSFRSQNRQRDRLTGARFLVVTATHGADDGVATSAAVVAAAADATAAGLHVSAGRQADVADEEDVDPRVDAAVEAGQQYGHRHHFTCTAIDNV